jgi:hypothetical protein
MSRPIAPPRPGEAKQFPLNVGGGVAFDLHVYCEVLAATWTGVINRAVRGFIDTELAQNAGFKVRFEELKRRLVEEDRSRSAGGGRLRLIRVASARNTQGPKAVSGRRPKRPTGGGRD